ncbi:MAG: tetratricopeptide repeat protein, partial [Spirochaetaceae bacterium]
QLGRTLFEQGRYAEAAQALEQALTAGRTHVRDRALLAMSYAHTERPAAALRVAEHAMDDAPDDPVVHLAYANVLYMDEQYEAAARAFERAREAGSSSRDARGGLIASLLALAQRDLRDGELPEADRHVQRALEVDPSHPQALALFVAIRERQDRDEGVIPALERLAERAPQAGDVRAELGKRYLEAGRTADAMDAFLDAEQRATDDPFAYLYLARRLADEAEDRQTVNRLHLAIGKGIERAGALRVQLTQRIDGGAEDWTTEDMEAIESIIERSEEPVAVIEDALAMLEDVHGDTEAFEEDLRRLSSWYPASTHLKAAVGALLERRGRWSEARRHWSQTVRDHPTLLDAHLGVARSLEELGRRRQARLAYRRALDRDPREPAVYDALRRVYRNDREALRTFYLDRIRMDGRNPVLLRAVADLEERMGLTEEAAEHRARRARILAEERADPPEQE